ncbi:hypothetical protein [Nocardioides sp. T2.26MG-1]|uniref:hypothetical protein n=1 Tax=Nocardioides sp. T2.26MG-1 TaxID=3041166 RepID=UPI0024776154|nr:hypothetical protein [Nocardioides sp. T2.26MG-1]CAI9409071.1 hypothetical protein HIDPHFAB_01212 [Nocardioides sp. T2.26MG-1]
MGRDDKPERERGVLGGLGTPAQPVRDGEVRLRTGTTLSCLVCGGGRFTRREIKLNTTGLTFMDLDWANRSGEGAICRACGYVHTFLDGDLAWGAPASDALL